MFEAAIHAAKTVLQTHIDALNSRDEVKLAQSLHFPHIRLSGTALKIWDGPEAYFGDFQARAGASWARSSFDDIRVQQATNTKVHLDVEVNRFDADDLLITSFRSLWVITFESGIWAAKMRSSFANK